MYATLQNLLQIWILGLDCDPSRGSKVSSITFTVRQNIYQHVQFC